MTNKTTMSVEHSQNKISIKKIKLNKVSKNDGCITKFKERAILKFCKENYTQSYQYDEMFNSNVLIEIGIC